MSYSIALPRVKSKSRRKRPQKPWPGWFLYTGLFCWCVGWSVYRILTIDDFGDMFYIAAYLVYIVALWPCVTSPYKPRLIDMRLWWGGLSLSLVPVLLPGV